MNSQAGKKRSPSLYTPEEEKLRRWKGRERRKCMVYIGSAIQPWRELKAENNLRRDKDLAFLLLRLYWKLFKTEAESSNILDALEKENGSSSDQSNDCSPPASPSVPEHVQLTLYSIPSTDLSSMEFVICKEAPELGQVLECAETALFAITDPVNGSRDLDAVHSQDRDGNSETYLVPEAMAEEEVVAVNPAEGEGSIPLEGEECRPTEEKALRLSEEWYFHPTKEEDLPLEDERFNPIKEYNFNLIKEKIAAEHRIRRTNRRPTTNLLNVTLLHEDDDLVGREFGSWEEFSLVFDAWCEKRKSLFFIQNATPLSKCQWRTIPPQPEVVEALKYSSVQLLCKESADSSPQEPGVWSGQKSCNARIILSISQSKDCLVVTECRLNHNHVLCPIKFETYKKGFLLSSHCLPVHITNIISRQFIGLWDVDRLLSACSSQDHDVLAILDVLKSLCVEDPLTKVKLVFVEDTTMVKMIFFQTYEMLRFCQSFPNALFFDRMVGFSEEFDLYTVLCMDGSERARECAYCLSRRGTPGILHTTLASLLQIMPKLPPKVQSVTVGVDVDELSAIRQMLPHSRVQICRYQVLETLCNKARELGTLYDEQARPVLCELVRSKSIAMYNQAVKKMNSFFSEQFMNYFWEHWHPLSTLWAEFFKDFKTCNAIIQLRQKLSWALRPSPTLAQCIADLMAMYAAKVEAGCFNDKLVAARYRTICLPEHSHLIEEELAMANLRTYDIQKNMMTFVLYDGVSSFIMDHKLISCSCSIYTSNLLPCRHLFATRFLMGQPLFDENLLVKEVP